MAEIVILGGGFGGLEAATRLRSALGDEHAITLIDRRAEFIVGAAKLWDLVGLEPVGVWRGELSGLEERGIRFVRSEIGSLDPEARSVETEQGRFSGDFLLVALGAGFAPVHVGALRPPAYNLYDPQSLPAMRDALDRLEKGRVAIVVMGVPYKCPPAPYEAALLIDHRLRERGLRGSVELAVYTVQPAPLPVAGPEASKKIAETLEARGIELHVGHKGVQIDVEKGTLVFAEGAAGRFDLLFGVPRHVAPPVIAESALAGPEGWIRPDPSTLETGYEHVYAIGDCISIPNALGEVPKAGVFAESQGRVVADRIIAAIEGRAGSTFDGLGYCFLEFAGGQAAKVEGDFLAEPRPEVSLKGPDAQIFRDKQAFVGDRIARWFED